MTDDDDKPPRPPRASWETPDPDEPAAQPNPRARAEPPPAWRPPPIEQPAKPSRSSRTPRKPPRASWETPDPDEPFEDEAAIVASEPSTPSSAITPRAPSTPGTQSSQSTPSTQNTPSTIDRGWQTPASGVPEPIPGATSTPSPTLERATVNQDGAPPAPPVGASGDAYAPPAPVEPGPAASIASSTGPTYGTSNTSGELRAEPFPITSGSAGIPQATTASGAIAARTGSTRVERDPLGGVDDELRDAVGVAPRSRRRRLPTDVGDDEDELGGDGPRRNRTAMFAGAVAIVLGLGVAAFVVLGRINSGRFVIACEPDRVVAEQGRSFPPWGTSALDDAEWKPIKIPPQAECRERETEDETELSAWYLDLLVERASSSLTAREVTNVDETAAMLEQALLHARAPDRRDKRKEIERLLGDVGYWRASAKLKEAATALSEAAKQFDEAAAQRPRHVTDASAWGAYVRRLSEELRLGPAGASSLAVPVSPPDRPDVPTGVALPVESDAGAGPVVAPGDAGVPETPDAGPPSGGVLL